MAAVACVVWGCWVKTSLVATALESPPPPETPPPSPRMASVVGSQATAAATVARIRTPVITLRIAVSLSSGMQRAHADFLEIHGVSVTVVLQTDVPQIGAPSAVRLPGLFLGRDRLKKQTWEPDRGRRPDLG